MAAAHEHADAVVGSGQDKLRLTRAQSFGTAAAQRIGKQDGVVMEGVGGVDAFLKVGAHVYAERVQAHGYELKVDGVRGAGDQLLQLAGKDLACDCFEAHSNGLCR
jgi:hypothetical protein